ncbi:MAG: SDR family oxidoreductase [Novosphingobium sp.]|nr:SDR family oxidoreductase [Novosphingobium sp.]
MPDSAPLPFHGPVYDMRALGFAAGEVVVITGGGSGIGRATALAAARSGLAVAIWDVTGDAADETARQARALGVAALPLTLDVADGAAVITAWEASRALGHCRYLVNNAGPASGTSGEFASLLAHAAGSMERVTTGWLERCGEDAASVVCLASIAGNFQGGGTTLQPFYPAAKAAIAGYVRWLATRHGGRPRANAIAPGLALTPRTIPLLEHPLVAETMTRIPMGRAAFAEEVASAILFLLSPAASYINGALLPVDGGWSIA